MDEPTDPLRHQLAVSALTTEHFVLQSARVATISEANGRSTLYLGTLSSATIAIAFIGQANELGDSFYLFALTLLPSVFLLGIFTFLRLVQTGIEDYVYGLGTLRIREYFLRLDPKVAPFFLPTDAAGIKRLQRMGMIPTGPLQGLLTAGSMVACINSIVGGVAVALAVRSLLDASVPVAAVTGAVAALAFAALFLSYGIRTFRGAAAVVPELYDWESSGIVDWSETVHRGDAGSSRRSRKERS
ncbi:MAG: hypothetical protein ACJ758_09305 [Actinomycetota bacterium]